MTVEHPHWNGLLKWLAARGMRASLLTVQPRPVPGAGYGLFALKSIASSEPLFTVPAAALLNVSTLSPHYPTAQLALSAVQLVSLHLLRFRPQDSQPSQDPLFGPYISALPCEFDFHPLTWISRKSDNEQLLQSLPETIMYSLVQLHERFRADWGTVREYLKTNPSLSPSTDPDLWERDFLWAWLNVNTRCVYHRLKLSRSDPDNFTLCPILDFANHTTGPIRMTPRAAAFPNKIGGDFTLMAPSENATRPDDELFLTYGSHPNRKLFIEYGFVNQKSEGNGELDLQGMIERLFDQRGSLGKRMKQELIDSTYWGDWTLHALPLPAHPSYRLITTLRLYHVLPLSTTNIPPDFEDILQSWYGVLWGNQEIISAENEAAWRLSLLQICQSLVDHATSTISQPVEKMHKTAWSEAMECNIRILWREELDVAKSVLRSIQRGIEF